MRCPSARGTCASGRRKWRRRLSAVAKKVREGGNVRLGPGRRGVHTARRKRAGLERKRLIPLHESSSWLAFPVVTSSSTRPALCFPQRPLLRNFVALARLSPGPRTRTRPREKSAERSRAWASPPTWSTSSKILFCLARLCVYRAPPPLKFWTMFLPKRRGARALESQRSSLRRRQHFWVYFGTCNWGGTARVSTSPPCGTGSF